MGQPVAFFEITSPDHERAQKFYAEMFGWQVAADPAMGGYGLVDTGAGESANRRGDRSRRGTGRQGREDLHAGR
jgi:predicted enzyme related to lactoylglutathione lyase